MIKHSLIALSVFVLFVFAYTPVADIVEMVTDWDTFIERADAFDYVHVDC